MTGASGLPSEDTWHASAVAIAGVGVAITGPSGSGKSGLALQLMALGAELVADDRTRIVLRDGYPWLLTPARLAGVIEARGVGLIAAESRAAAPLRLIVDMAEAETERLPTRHQKDVFGHPIEVVRRVDAPHFASSIVALAKGGFWQNEWR